MAQLSRFFDNVNYTESQFAETMNRLLDEGVIAGVGGELAPSTPGGLFVRIAAGEGMIQGFWFQNTANVDLAIGANNSGSPRTDSVVLRLDRTNNTVTLVVVPNNPAPNRTPGGGWEMQLATVTVPSGTGTVTVTDQRQSVNCGYTGQGLSRVGASRSAVHLGSYIDRDTGVFFSGPNAYEIVAGGIPGFYQAGGNVGIGSEATVTNVVMGRAGINVNVGGGLVVGAGLAVGANVTVATTLAVTGAVTFSSTLGVTGNATFGGTTTLGNVTPANSNTNGGVFIFHPSAQTVVNLQCLDGQYVYLGMQNTTGTKVFAQFLGTGAGSTGIGANGDYNCYTGGTAGGGYRVGTNALQRWGVTNTGIHVWGDGNLTGGAKFNFFQASNALGGGIRVYNTNTNVYQDFYSDATGTAVISHMGTNCAWFNGGKMSLGASSFGAGTGRLTIVQQAAGSAEGLIVGYGGGIIRAYIDSAGDTHLQSATTQVVLGYASSNFRPNVDQGAFLGLGSHRWANVYTMALTCYGAASFAGALSGITNISMAGGISGVTTIGASSTIATSGNISAGNNLSGEFVFANQLLLPDTDNGAKCGQSGQMWSELWTHTAYKPGGGSWTSTSDDKAKRDEFVPFTQGLDVVTALEPVVFRYNGLYGTPTDKEFVGFRAQELQKVAPEMVGKIRAKKHNLPEDPWEDVLTVDPSRLDYILLNAVKELAGRVADLEKQLKERKN